MIFYIPKDYSFKQYYWKITIGLPDIFSIQKCENKNWDLNILMKQAISDIGKIKDKRKKINRMQYITGN